MAIVLGPQAGPAAGYRRVSSIHAGVERRDQDLPPGVAQGPGLRSTDGGDAGLGSARPRRRGADDLGLDQLDPVVEVDRADVVALGELANLGGTTVDTERVHDPERLKLLDPALVLQALQVVAQGGLSGLGLLLEAADHGLVTNLARGSLGLQ